MWLRWSSDWYDFLPPPVTEEEEDEEDEETSDEEEEDEEECLGILRGFSDMLSRYV